MACSKLERYLRENEVGFNTGRHGKSVYTAQEVAGALGVSGKCFAKVVMVIADGRLVMLVLPAHHCVVFDHNLRFLLEANNVRLAKEVEFAECFGERRQFCQAGAMCPFGHLYGFRVHLDSALVEVSQIVFRAGTHRDVICLTSRDYLRLVNPQVAELSVSARPKRLKKRKKKRWWRRLLGL